MSIPSEISRLSGNVSAALTAISNKGVTVPSGSNSDDLADLIAQISGGGGTTWETLLNQNVQIVSSSPNYIWVDNYTEPFSANETYRVTWGSNTYTCQTIYDTNNITYDGWYIGDGEAAGGQSTGNHEPFMIYRYKNAANVLVAATTTAAGTIFLKLERQVSSGGSTLITKSITANGTYNAEDDDADGYSSVTVNVSGSSKNVQIAAGVNRVATTEYTAVSGQSLTVSKTGKYDVYWTGFRSSTNGTNGSQLYIGGSAYGSAQTTFSNNGQSVHLSNVSLTKDQVIAVYARARGTNYYMYAGNLTIIES